MSTQAFPLSGCLASALQMQTTLANSVLHLFKAAFAPTPSSILADFNGAECDYDSYAVLTFTAWNTPILSPGSGYMIQSPLVQFFFPTGGAGVGNSVGGCYLVDAAGVLRLYVIFTQPIPMQVPGQGIPISLLWFFPTNLQTGP